MAEMEKSNSFLHEEKKDFVLVTKKPKKPLTKEIFYATMILQKYTTRRDRP